MKIGDFVRFKSAIVLENHHLALVDDKAIVVGLDDKGRTARVVWSDGASGQYLVTKLTRCEGQIGKAVCEPRRPVKDWGHKPIPTPPRIVHAIVPTPPNPDNYDGTAVTTKHYIPGKPKLNKAGELKETMIPCLMHKIRITCKRSGRSFTFTGSCRDGRWKYTGNNHKGISVNDMRAELVRMMGQDKAEKVLSGLMGDPMPLGDYKMMYADAA